MQIPEDPVMLLSFINMKLRDTYSSFEMLTEDMNLDNEAIVRKLAAIDYRYDRGSNQFR